MRTVEDLYRAHARHVLAYALRRTDAATADDVVSEVFLIVERRLEDVPADARPWLYGVARRVLANQRRAAGRRSALHDALGVLVRDRAPAAPPAFPADVPLLEALAALRADDREVLMLTAWEGLDAAAAAAVLGCSTAAVHTRLHRARGRLQVALDRLGGRTPVTTTAARTTR
ncbi:RNA polymerase sigma factor [Solirubrobacter soli]|uniref:RNA polymerase sigma factor n=1 Tax=Solirubrobacter soli TaxID=363832 RepID=UPI0004212F68|nr:RNA polymerase sigma factor [Solirubrobacter soli]